MNYHVLPPHGSKVPLVPVQDYDCPPPQKAPALDATQDAGPPSLQDLKLLTDYSFDILWEAEIVHGELEINIHMLKDLSVDVGLPPGSFGLTLAYEEWFALIHPEDQPHVLRSIQDAVQTSGRYVEEYRVRHQDRSDVWFEGTGYPVAFRDGRAIRWLGAVRNVTERKQREVRLIKALQDAEAMKSRLEAQVRVLREEMQGGESTEPVIGNHPSFKRVCKQAELVSQTESTVLLTGETGTGKGLLAHVIHRRSRRKDKPLVTVNCAALPSTLIESELFGHCRGAFTGATSNRIGRFEVAHEGTIFLDEIGEMPLDVQAKLLRVLESGEFERVGSTKTQKVDVRVIAATNRDLNRLVQENRFRSDLFYRLQVFPIAVPPLRERPEDIPLLAAYVLESKCAELGRELKQISADSMRQLQCYGWPGNVRELENVIERAIILSDGPELDLDAEKLPAAEPPKISVSFADSTYGESQNLDEIERRHILSVCESANWHIKGPDGAAARLGMNPSTLYFRMKKHGISRPT